MKKLLFMIGSEDNNPEDWNLNYQSDEGQFLLVTGPDETLAKLRKMSNDDFMFKVPNILQIELWIADQLKAQYPDCSFELLTALYLVQTPDETLSTEGYE